VNFAQLLDGHPDGQVALIGRAGQTTYGELADQVARLRGGLAASGIDRSDRVAVIAANNELFVTALLAVLGIGATGVLLNPASPPYELERELRAADVVALVAGPAGATTLASVDSGLLEGMKLVALPDGAQLPVGRSLVDLAGGGAVPMVDVDPADPAVVLFTSGTSGEPRGAVLSHHNLLVNHEQVLAADPEAVTASDVVLAVLPLFHVYGLNVVLGLSLRLGATVVLEERFDPARSLETVERHNVTVVAAGPPVWTAWAVAAESSQALTALRRARSGAAALPLRTAEVMADVYGVTVAEGYGLTEASPVVTLPPGNVVRRGSIGLPVPGIEVRLVDLDGEDALVGDPGEVWVRGPNVFSGYLDGGASPVDADGWLHTGDVAVTDDDGWLYLVDRIKDVIIVSGFNVYPAEVEDVLLAHPSVSAAAVVGTGDPVTGERIVAHVVSAAGAFIEEEALMRHAAEILPRFKCPSRIDVHDELPVGLGGKTPRRLLRDS
jgi:long-chain acyl-CoA synthetase